MIYSFLQTPLKRQSKIDIFVAVFNSLLAVWLRESHRAISFDTCTLIHCMYSYCILPLIINSYITSCTNILWQCHCGYGGCRWLHVIIPKAHFLSSLYQNFFKFSTMIHCIVIYQNLGDYKLIYILLFFAFLCDFSVFLLTWLNHVSYQVLIRITYILLFLFVSVFTFKSVDLEYNHIPS